MEDSVREMKMINKEVDQTKSSSMVFLPSQQEPASVEEMVKRQSSGRSFAKNSREDLPKKDLSMDELLAKNDKEV